MWYVDNSRPTESIFEVHEKYLEHIGQEDMIEDVKLFYRMNWTELLDSTKNLCHGT